MARLKEDVLIFLPVPYLRLPPVKSTVHWKICRKCTFRGFWDPTAWNSWTVLSTDNPLHIYSPWILMVLYLFWDCEPVLFFRLNFNLKWWKTLFYSPACLRYCTLYSASELQVTEKKTKYVKISTIHLLYVLYCLYCIRTTYPSTSISSR